MSAPIPAYPASKTIANVSFDRFRCHRGDGDMWPITWADDDNLYGAAGDNSASPMNFWRIRLRSDGTFLGDRLGCLSGTSASNAD